MEGQGGIGQSCNNDDNEGQGRGTTMTTIVYCVWYRMDCIVSCAFEQISARYLQISADICIYLHISADICRYLQISRHTSRYLVTSVDICHRDLISADRKNGKGVFCFPFLFCEKTKL
jgi:hypothetical protein